MFLSLLLLFLASTCQGFTIGWHEDQVICAGRNFSVPVHSRSRVVTFTPNSPNGPRRILLENNDLKDPRYEWTRDMTLLIPEVTDADQGLYAIKSFSNGFTYETVRLTVSECVSKLRRKYGETLKLKIPKNGALLEFVSVRSVSPSAFAPVILWNLTGAEDSQVNQRKSDDHWVVEKLVPMDQGNYTFRDASGKVLSRYSLIVTAHSFNFTLISKDTLFLTLLVPVEEAHLHFSPAFSPSNTRVLLQSGQIADHQPNYEGRLSLEQNSTGTYVVVAMLSHKDDGIYDLRDWEGTLVSTTVLRVKDKYIRWRALIKSITVPSGMFATLAGFMLFMKRYPSCSIAKILSGLRERNNGSNATQPRIHVQDFSEPHITTYSSSPRGGRTLAKWTSSPTHTGYYPAIESPQRSFPKPAQEPDGVRRSSAINVINEEAGVERKTTVSVPGTPDCLHSSMTCLQFQIKPQRGKDGGMVDGKEGKEKDYYSMLPLDTDTSNICSVYTSDKLNFL